MASELAPSERSQSATATAVLQSQQLQLVGIYLVSMIVVLVAWDRASAGFGFPTLFPGPWEVLRRVVGLLETGKLEIATLASMGRIAAGFVIGSALGAAIGLVMGYFPAGRAIGAPLVHFLRFIPAMAWFAPFLLWFGVGEQTRILLIVYTTIFIVILNTIAGVAAVAPNKTRMARSFGATPWQVFRLITLPGSAPFILTGMRIAMGNSFMTVVAAEMLAGGSGLGYLVFSATVSLDTTTIFAGVLVLGTLGLLTDGFLAFLTRRYGGKYYVRQAAFDQAA